MDFYQHEYDFSMEDAVKKWRTLTADDRTLLEKEFKALRKFDPNRATIAVHPKNKSKNRYGSVYPYDEDFCRVCLEKDNHDQSDYINASIIRSIPPTEISSSTSRFFYVAQGPLEHTLDDFLRMIVEQKITVIVMLSFPYDPITSTYAEEHASYFSDKINTVIETKSYKILTATILSAYRCIGRRLRIKSKLKDTVHDCEQYHYPYFVDKGVPTDYHSIIGLVENYHQYFLFDHEKSFEYNSSAGVGRSGVFIALYYLLEAMELRQMLNVKQLVDTMRLYRPHLVQTTEQYEYIYRCLAEIAIHPHDVRSIDQFVDYFHRLLPTARLEDSPIYIDFQNRENRVELDTYLTTTMAEQHPNCNRNKSYIPYDRNRVFLHSPSESMYINASKMTNLYGASGIILTQEPMKTTLQPFFSMLLLEHKIFIVAVEEMEKPKYAEGKFVGRNEINVDTLTVCQSKNKFGSYQRSYKLKVKHSNIRESDVFIFEYTGEWSNEQASLPRNLEQFVRFVDRSIYHQRKIDPNRLGLVVHDREGGSKAAFYCIAQNLLDRLLIDRQISIENFVTNICQQRMNALLSLEQYVALHQIVCIWNDLKRRGALECTVNNDYM